MERQFRFLPNRSAFVALIVVFVCALVLQSAYVGSAVPTAKAQPLPTATPTLTTPTPTYFTYSAKFLCGVQQPVSLGEPTVKPGNYATEINIHNFMYQRVGVRKKVLVVVDPQQGPVGREPNQVEPRALDTIYLRNDGATMDDCNRIWQLLYPGMALPSPMPFMSGTLVLISRQDIDVDVVHTVSIRVPQSDPSASVSIDVERVPGKKVAIPNNLFPGGPLQP
jgi:hypothetical protein